MSIKTRLLSGVAFGILAASSPAIAAPPPPPPAIYSWTGFYLGGTVGYSWGNGAVTYNEPALGGFGLPTSFSSPRNLPGAIGGPEIGYNWQISNLWVAGIEADFQWSGEKASGSFSNPYTFSGDCEGSCAATFSGTLSSRILWFGTVRGRLGALITPTTLVYGTAGLAYGRVSVSGSFSDTSFTPPAMWSFSQTTTKVGGVLGAGIEGAVPATRNWTWKVEYLYLDLGSVSGSGFDTDFGGPYYWNAHFTDNILRFGINYSFH